MKKCLPAAAVLALAIGLSSCASVPDPASIPPETTARELVQRAQEATDASNWEAARVYYSTAKERFSKDMSVVCACEYELAFLDWKTRKYEAARTGFTALLARYASPDAALLPQEYKTLAERILAKVEEKLAAKMAPAKAARSD